MNPNDPATQLRVRTALQTLERLPMGLDAATLCRQVDSLVGEPTTPGEAEELVTLLVAKKWVYPVRDALGRTLYRISTAGRDAVYGI